MIEPAIHATFVQPYLSHVAVAVRFQRSPKPSLRFRLDGMARRLGYSPEMILGPRRNRPLVNARFVIAKVFREEGHSLPAIADAMNRDHTSIMYLLRRGVIE